MKFIFSIALCLLFLFSSCLYDQNEKRIYIKSVKIDSASRFDWYITSLIGGFSRSTIIKVTGNKEQFILKSHGITNISLDKARRLLIIESTDELENFDEADTLDLGDNFKATFNKKGFYMNDAEGRFSRLKIKEINTSVPHNVNSDF